MSARIPLNRERIAEFCQRWKITEFALFGSVLRNDFCSDSDVDVLVTFTSDSHWTLFDMVHMQNELQEIMGRRVDLISRRGLEASRNYLRRDAILSSAEVVHVA